MAATTVFALSSGQPPSGIAVVRISGPAARNSLLFLTGRQLPLARRATLRRLIDPGTNDLLDQALVLWLPGPDTVTGEDMAELHLHGSRAVVDAVLDTLGQIEGLEPAKPGAFTRRAFENGRMDLSQIEGLADLLAAETAAQRRSAIALEEGALGRLVTDWRKAVLAVSAQIEAQLDHVDEEDAQQSPDTACIAVLVSEARHWLHAPSAERLRNGIRVVLAGPPNAGKSSLLNALIGRDAAIVSPNAGTTRDIIEAPVTLNGIPFLFIDTAGLHEAGHDCIEVEGMNRARAALESADIILWLGAKETMPD
ncbi:MAG: tRNA uridine-5-carboxymethylaminomethyl(34) synthesis GTPase MnmE, partial [Alphaproteobacteria bacterium]|nr:tRNA uridine-5-carboxymethylaminomethyl(34) synthesis GTPase MnmE [Alphaproteobacteria bacterium]